MQGKQESLPRLKRVSKNTKNSSTTIPQSPPGLNKVGIWREAESAEGDEGVGVREGYLLKEGIGSETKFDAWLIHSGTPLPPPETGKRQHRLKMKPSKWKKHRSSGGGLKLSLSFFKLQPDDRT